MHISTHLHNILCNSYHIGITFQLKNQGWISETRIMYRINQNFHILLLAATAHIIALITFINGHHKMLETISEVHTVTMRPRHVFHIPAANTAVY